MKYLFIVCLVIFYLFFLIGIVSILPQGTMKIIPGTVITVALVVQFLCHFFLKKRYLLLDILFIMSVCLISTVAMDFIIAFISPPKEYAVDCAGHHGMEMQWMWGFIAGPLLCLFLSFFYFKGKPPSYLKLEKGLALLSILLIALSYFNSKPIPDIQEYMNKVQTPELVFPKGCK